MVWLLPAPEATATFVKDCLLQWFAVFGVCNEWVSDQGTHFKNEVITELQHVLGTHHHFTTSCCPWANGTVEVVMRQLLRLFRTCLSEWRMAPDQWPEAHLIIMLVLNQLPLPSAVWPVTAISGRPAMSPADTMALPGQIMSATLAEVEKGQRENIAAAQLALEEMHKQISVVNTRKHDRSRQYDKKKGVQIAQFVVGDPAVVTEVTSNWVYDVEILLTHDLRLVHTSRLKFYADCDLDVTSELLAHIVHNSEGFIVEAMMDARYVP
ncbi:hypothetical protein AaE_007718 [Aphanomyces astaci]|uniref:Integrase catalytic domain-containing protein n=1 Tax=Aphanomyces astaci TaxID=112090 RepID=A0A6A5AH73_APHAT|nr:hypothetical protein AaE_007718 [Aphanomyces astaci]